MKSTTITFNNITHKPNITTNIPELKSEVVIEKYQQNDWEFTFEKSRISSSNELDQMVDALKLQGVPDIVYGKNTFKLTYNPNKFIFRINVRDSLSYCNFEKLNNTYMINYDKDNKRNPLESINVLPAEIKVKHAEFWKNKKIDNNTEIKILEKISDWTYSSPYKGTVVIQQEKKDINEDISINFDNIGIGKGKDTGPRVPFVEVTSEDIPVHNLGPNNEIKFYQELMLFEDELEDCGVSQSSVRFRVMGDCFFGLLRSYLRVDDVLIRVYDTRFYHEFGKNYILREFCWKESTYEELKKIGFKFNTEFNMNPKQSDIVNKDLNLKLTFKDKLYYK